MKWTTTLIITEASWSHLSICIVCSSLSVCKFSEFRQLIPSSTRFVVSNETGKMALTAFNPLFVIFFSQVSLSSVVIGFASASSPWRLISPLFSLGCAAITTEYPRDFVRPFWKALLADSHSSLDRRPQANLVLWSVPSFDGVEVAEAVLELVEDSKYEGGTVMTYTPYAGKAVDIEALFAPLKEASYAPVRKVLKEERESGLKNWSSQSKIPLYMWITIPLRPRFSSGVE